jgi:hypothetical protein
MWPFLPKKCDCPNTPTNPGTSCDHSGLTTNDLIYNGPNGVCSNVTTEMTVTEAFQQLDYFLCSVAFTQYLLDLIQNNPNLFPNFITLVNGAINCSTIIACGPPPIDCTFTGSVNQVPDPTTTTTSSSSSTSTSTSTSSSTTTTTSSSSTTTTSSSSTTTTTTTIPPCSYVLLTDSNGYVLRYILATNTVTTLFNSSVSANDLAHSNDKLWLNTANTIHEYDITLSPWSQTFNRNISTGSVQTGFALGKPPGINNKLVTVDVSRSPGVIVELDITNSPATSVDIATLPAGAVTPGDLLITDTAQPKILINLTSVTSGANGLYQYDYNTGAFEIYVPLGLATSAFGIYEEGNLIYLVTGPGLTYSLLPTPPYTVTLVQAIPTANPGQIIVGGSQLSECTEVTLTIPPTTTTTTTI